MAIVATAIAMVVASLATWLYLREQVIESRFAALQFEAGSRVRELEYEVEAATEIAEALAVRPGIARAMHAIAAGPPDSEEAAKALQTIRRSAEMFAHSRSTVVAYEDPSGNRLAAAGAFQPPTEIWLPVPGSESRLLWTDRMYLSTRLPITLDDAVVGYMVVERPLPAATNLVLRSDAIGRTGEVGLCGYDGTRRVCFPTRFGAAGRVDVRDDSAMRPTDRALRGETGTVETVDYRGVRTYAALTRVNRLGVALIVKQDVDEVLAPMRARAAIGAALLALLLSVGALAVRFKLAPLAAALVASRDDAQALAAQLAVERERQQRLTDALPALVSYVDSQQVYRSCNAMYEQAFGVKPSAIVGHTVRELVGERDYAEVAPYLKRALAGERLTYEKTYHTPAGPSYRESTYVPDFDADGRVRGIMVLTVDLTKMRQAQQAVEREGERVRTVADNVPLPIAFLDPEYRHLFVNAAHAAWFGGSASAMIGISLETLVGEEVFVAYRGAMLQSAAQRAPVKLIREVVRNRRRRVVECTFVAQHHADGTLQGYCVVKNDITEAHERERDLMHAARRDSLTGLPNRPAFHERLAQVLLHPFDGGRFTVVAYIDIDHFKRINDTYGHLAADCVLKEFAQRVQAVLKNADLLARLGGDEFGIVLHNVHGAEDVDAIARNIRAAVAQPIVVDDREIRVTVSMGFACVGTSDDERSALARADRALYEAKGAGRDTWSKALDECTHARAAETATPLMLV